MVLDGGCSSNHLIGFTLLLYRINSTLFAKLPLNQQIFKSFKQNWTNKFHQKINFRIIRYIQCLTVSNFLKKQRQNCNAFRFNTISFPKNKNYRLQCISLYDICSLLWPYSHQRLNWSRYIPLQYFNSILITFSLYPCIRLNLKTLKKKNRSNSIFYSRTSFLHNDIY